MPEIVEDLGVVSINARRYRLLSGQNDVPGKVTTHIASRFAPKIVTGDTTKDSDPTRSSLIFNDYRGGLGVEYMRDASDVNRAFLSSLSLRYVGHLTLNPDTVQTAAATAAVVGFINELADTIYASYGTDVHSYNNGTDSWGSSLRTLAAAATDSINIRLKGTVYLVIAQTSDWDYTSDGSSYTRVTDDAKFLADFDDKLWIIDNTGQVRSYSDVAATAVTGPQLPLPDGYVKGWVKGRDSLGNQILFASTTVGLYALDIGNNKFVKTEPDFPNHPDNGLAARWRDAVYYVAGEGLWKFTQGGGTAVVQPVGLDRDHGLHQLEAGPIVAIEATHTELLVTVAPATSGVGLAGLYAWDGIGWQQYEVFVVSVGDVKPLHSSSAYSIYRLWFGQGNRVSHMQLQTHRISAERLVGLPTIPVYNSEQRVHYTPWFDAFQTDVEKLALRVRADVQEIGTNGLGNVIIQFQINRDEATAATTLATITTTGETILTFPDNGSNPDIGTLFREIRFIVSMNRGSGTTSTPDLKSLTLEYRKKLPEKLGFRVQLDLSKDSPDGRTPIEQLADLVTARQSSTLIEFTFRNDDAAGNPRNYYVDIQDSTSLEDSGLDESGIVTMALVEP